MVLDVLEIIETVFDAFPSVLAASLTGLLDLWTASKVEIIHTRVLRIIARYHSKLMWYISFGWP
jgi:hypothetical protein